MDHEARIRCLRIALTAVGVVFIFGLVILMPLWPSGWQWLPLHEEYEHMIMGVYATLGLFLVLAARDPLQHLSLLRFTMWSSVVHGAIMGVHALLDQAERGHLAGDVPFLFVVALVLATLMPARASVPASHERSAPRGGWISQVETRHNCNRPVERFPLRSANQVVGRLGRARPRGWP